MEMDTLLGLIESATLVLSNTRLCREWPGLADKAAAMLARLYAGVNAASLGPIEDDEEEAY